MIKIFVQTNHRELETLVNNWISSNHIMVINIHHSICALENELVHSVIIHYQTQDSIPC